MFVPEMYTVDYFPTFANFRLQKFKALVLTHLCLAADQHKRAGHREQHMMMAGWAATIRVVGIPVSRRSGNQLATTLGVTVNHIIFFLFSPRFPPWSTFLIQGVLGSKNLFDKN